MSDAIKKWPFVESPGEFADRLAAALREFGHTLPAVRNVLIETPPKMSAEYLAALAAQQPAQGEAVVRVDSIALGGRVVGTLRKGANAAEVVGALLYTAPPATTSTVGAACVPDAVRVPEVGWTHSDRDRAYAQGWNACRAAMLASAPDVPQ